MKTTKWLSDQTHSEVQFKIKHLMISTVTGYLKSFDITIESNDQDFKNASINFTGEVNSIDTYNQQRNEHLITSDFFNAAQYPKITFQSSKMEKINDDNYKLYGDITIKNITKSIVLNVEYGGTAQDRFGKTKAGLTFDAIINRHDFGVGPINPGLGNEVKFYSSIQLEKQI